MVFEVLAQQAVRGLPEELLWEVVLCHSVVLRATFSALSGIECITL